MPAPDEPESMNTRARFLERKTWPLPTRMASAEIDLDMIQELVRDNHRAALDQNKEDHQEAMGEIRELRAEVKGLRNSLYTFSLTIAASAIALCGTILAAT